LAKILVGAEEHLVWRSSVMIRDYAAARHHCGLSLLS